MKIKKLGIKKLGD